MRNNFEFYDLNRNNTLVPLEEYDENQTCDVSNARYLVVEDMLAEEVFTRIDLIRKELKQHDITFIACLLLDAALLELEMHGISEEFRNKYQV